MSYLFSDCIFLENINLEGINTANVEDMSYMFSNCRNIKSLDIKNFKTEKEYVYYYE